jgi:hypothetical protein
LIAVLCGLLIACGPAAVETGIHPSGSQPPADARRGERGSTAAVGGAQTPVAEVAPPDVETAAAITALCAQRFPERDVRAVAMIFVLPDCPIANSYAAEYTRLSKSYAERGVLLVIVHVDPDLSEERMRAHAADFRIECPVVADSEHVWVRRAGATRTPEAAVFDLDGRLLYRGRIDDRYAGVGKRRNEATTHDLRDALDAIVNGKPVPNPRTEAVGCPVPDLSQGE